MKAGRIIPVKFKSVACTYDAATTTQTFTAIPTRPRAMHDLADAHVGEPVEVVKRVGPALA